MQETEVKIINNSKHELPAYETIYSAGMDLRANLEDNFIDLKPLERVIIPTGLFIELPEGIEAQIRPRSGLAAKTGVTVLNTPGTIDADYRGEIKIILINLSDTIVEIRDGERIAQIVVAKHERVKWVPASELTETVRGEGGLGHTGRN